ncbi:hypothetical protein AAIP46_003514, partial [Yersinia ruckeri]
MSFSAQAKNINDIMGRQVTVPDNPQRIILGESRMLYTLALLEPGNPAQRIIGWPGDIAYYDAQSWQQYLQKFPEMAKVPIIAQGSIRQINVEKIIELQPDLVILSRYAKNNADEDSMLNGLT